MSKPRYCKADAFIKISLNFGWLKCSAGFNEDKAVLHVMQIYDIVSERELAVHKKLNIVFLSSRSILPIELAYLLSKSKYRI